MRIGTEQVIEQKLLAYMCELPPDQFVMLGEFFVQVDCEGIVTLCSESAMRLFRLDSHYRQERNVLADLFKRIDIEIHDYIHFDRYVAGEGSESVTIPIQIFIYQYCLSLSIHTSDVNETQRGDMLLLLGELTFHKQEIQSELSTTDLDKLPMRIFCLDMSHNLVAANQAFYDHCDTIRGCAANKPSSHDYDCHCSHFSWQCSRYRDKRLPVSQKSLTRREYYESDSGRSKVVETHTFPIVDNSGEIIAIGGCVNEVGILRSDQEILKLIHPSTIHELIGFCPKRLFGFGACAQMVFTYSQARIALYLFAGYTVPEIAIAVSRSRRTLEQQVDSIKRKLGGCERKSDIVRSLIKLDFLESFRSV